MLTRRLLFVVLMVLLCGTCAWAQGRGHERGMVSPKNLARNSGFRAARLLRSGLRHTPAFRYSRWGNGARLHRRHNSSPYVYGALSRGFYGYGHRGWRAGGPYYYGGYASPYYHSAWYAAPYHGYPGRYYYSPYFPYLYFYDLYYRESLHSKEAADQYEGSAARGQDEAAAPSDNPESASELESRSAASDSAALSPRNVLLTVDGEDRAPSPSGSPLVLGSGRHALRISSRHGERPAAVPANSPPY